MTRLIKRARHERILAELRANPTLRVARLARDFGVSTETIRRDLDELSSEGRVDRTYGGAARPSAAFEAAVSERLKERVAERERIGKRAEADIRAGEMLMIDGGSTTVYFARRLAAECENLVVMTNSLAVATALARNPALRVVLCPGDYDPHEGIVTGPETLEFLSRFAADRAVIGAGGLTHEGPSEVLPGAAWVKRRMLERARRGILLLDATKLGVRRHERVCPLAALDDLYTDRSPSGELAQALHRAKVTVHVA